MPQKIYIQKEEEPLEVLNKLSELEENLDLEIYLPEDANLIKDENAKNLLSNWIDDRASDIQFFVPNQDYASELESLGWDVEVSDEGDNFFDDLEEELGDENSKSMDMEGPEEVSGEKRSSEPEPTTEEGSEEDTIAKNFIKMSDIREAGKSQESYTVEKKEKPSEQEGYDSSPDAKPGKGDFETEDISFSKDDIEEDTIESDKSSAIESFGASSNKGDSMGVVRNSGSNWWPLFGWGILLLLIIGLGWWLFFYLPFANIKISTAKQVTQLDLQLQAKESASDISVDQNIIPLEIASIQDTRSKSFVPSKEKELDENAQGTITVHNEWESSVTMIPSRFESSEGHIYWSQERVTMPAATRSSGELEPGTLELKVKAAETGSEPNISCSDSDPCEFTIPAWEGTENYEKVYGIATSDITGGASGSGRIITKEDLDNAKTELKKQFSSELVSKLNQKLASSTALLEQTVENDISYRFDNEAGEMTDQFSGTATFSVKGIAIDNKDINSIVDQKIKGKIKEDQKTFPDTIDFSMQVIDYSLDEGQATLSISASEQVGWKLDKTEIMESLVGKSKVGVRNVLNKKSTIQSAEIRLWPFWVQSMPTRQDRIEIEIL